MEGNKVASSVATGAGTSEVTSPPYCAISRMNRLLMETSAGLHGRYTVRTPLTELDAAELETLKGLIEANR